MLFPTSSFSENAFKLIFSESEGFARLIGFYQLRRHFGKRKKADLRENRIDLSLLESKFFSLVSCLFYVCAGSSRLWHIFGSRVCDKDLLSYQAHKHVIAIKARSKRNRRVCGLNVDACLCVIPDEARSRFFCDISEFESVPEN